MQETVYNIFTEILQQICMTNTNFMHN